MGNPTHTELVKRIRALEKQIAVLSDKAAAVKPMYGLRTFAEQSPNMIFINKGGPYRLC
jgi:hypothetical protein